MQPPTAEPIAVLRDNYAYLIPTAEHGAIVVDPSEGQKVSDALEKSGRALRGILITHHHHDHIGGIDWLIEKYADGVTLGKRQTPTIEVVASAYDVARCRVPHASRAASDNETLSLASEHFVVMHVPGHTQGAVVYWWQAGQALFVGDTLFSGGCGRLIEGEASQLFASLQRIRRLPPETRIFCGHEYTRKNLAFAHRIDPDNQAIKARLEKLHAPDANVCTMPASLAVELETNLFLRADDPFLATRLGCEPGLATFTKLRELRDQF